MTSTPNIDELKASTESGKLVDAYRLFIVNGKAEEQSLIARIGEESSQLRAVIEKTEKTITEASSLFPPFNVVAATGYHCLMEIQMKDRRKLDLLAQLLTLCRQSLEEKEQLLEDLDEAEIDDNDD